MNEREREGVRKRGERRMVTEERRIGGEVVDKKNESKKE